LARRSRCTTPRSSRPPSTASSKLEAIAHELAAGFWIERGKPAFAGVHLGKARDLCHHWGARLRSRDLELRRRRLGATTDLHTTSRSTSALSSTLDFATVLKASQALATTWCSTACWRGWMEIIIENTGAQAGSIVLESNGALFVHASKAPDAAVSVGGPVAARERARHLRGDRELCDAHRRVASCSAMRRATPRSASRRRRAAGAGRAPSFACRSRTRSG